MLLINSVVTLQGFLLHAWKVVLCIGDEGGALCRCRGMSVQTTSRPCRQAEIVDLDVEGRKVFTGLDCAIEFCLKYTIS